MSRLHPLDPDLARSLAMRRRALGWSQNRLALAATRCSSADLTEAAIAKYETLRCPIPPDKWAAIEHALSQAEQAPQRTTAAT
jgi:hypothetical protein